MTDHMTRSDLIRLRDAIEAVLRDSRIHWDIANCEGMAVPGSYGRINELAALAALIERTPE